MPTKEEGFRTHDGDNGINENSGGSAKSSSNTLCAYEDEGVMRALTRWSRVFVALAEYRLQLLNEASFKELTTCTCSTCTASNIAFSVR